MRVKLIKFTFTHCVFFRLLLIAPLLDKVVQTIIFVIEENCEIKIKNITNLSYIAIPPLVCSNTALTLPDLAKYEILPISGKGDV